MNLMAEKQVYPMLSEKSWWQIRNQFKKTIPSVVNVSYLKSLLSLNSDQSARNIMAPLRQMKIIDLEGKPLPRATDWRSDTKYPEVCNTIISEIYPQELLDLFPDPQIDNAAAKSWFMDTCSLGNNAAGKIVSTFSLLKSGEIKTDVDAVKPSPSKRRKKKVQEDQANMRTADKEDSVPTQTEDVALSVANASLAPAVHIDLQIHISPDASAEQIDKIFASMAKHLYGKV